MNTKCAEILTEIVNRFERMDKSYPAIENYHCWSTAHSMAHDANRALDTLSDVPDELRAVIARIIKDAFDCGFNATDEHAFWFFDGIAAADRALEDHWVTKPSNFEFNRLTPQ